MENNNFDRRIREQLQGLEGEYQAGDWERMEQKLNEAFNPAPEMEDVLLDGMAYGSLRDIEVEYNPAHWDLMEQKIDGRVAIRRKIYRYKIAEIALVLLAIFTILQFLPFGKQKAAATKDITDSPAIESSNALGLNSSLLDNNDKENVSAQEVTATNTETTKGFTDIQTSKNPSMGAENDNPGVADALAKDVSKGNNNIVEATEGVFNITENLFEDKIAALDRGKSKLFDSEYDNSGLSIGNRYSGTGTSAKPDFRSLSPIALFAPGEINVLHQSSLPECILCNAKRSPIRISIGMAVGPDADYVVTPYDTKYQQEEFGQIALGYSGGFTLGFKYNKWELETGAVYASTSYGSRNILEISGSFAQGGYVRQGLLGAQLDIVRVPLNLRYNFLDKKKWNYYLVTGGSVNMAVETLYEYTTETVGRFNANVSRNAVMQDASAYDGIFEGGDFLDNTFLTANLGLGVERYFNSRMSIFFQPTYSHQLSKGLGPQKDKFYSLSIMTGARVTLKKKNKN